MIAADKIDFAKLKEAVKELNASGLVEESIKTVGTGKEALATLFGDTIDAMNEETAAQLPEAVVDMYNALFSDEVEEEEKVEKEVKAAKPAKEKKEKVAKEPKPKKEVARGPFGSVVGSAANAIDELIAAGTTVEEIMAKAGVTRTRAVTHIKFVETTRGVVITKDGDKVTGKLPSK